MWCYFLLHGHIAGVEVLPLGLSDEDAIERALILLSKRKGAFDGLEVWDGARFVFRQPLSAANTLAAGQSRQGAPPTSLSLTAK
jgi:hypothetical protein